MATNQAERERVGFVHDAAGGLLTVRIRGEIDHHTAVRIREGVDHLLYERRPQKFLLDLSAVSFMDSSGLGLIMGRLALVRELGGEMVVWNPASEIRSILDLAGMERFVRIEYSAQTRGTSTSPPSKPRVESRAEGKRTRRRPPAPVTTVQDRKKEKEA